MVEIRFGEPPHGEGVDDISSECQRQLHPIVNEIVRSAVAAGWNQKDVLLGLVEVAWDLYEKRQGDL
ncbi:hypothetical protein QD460_04535 [Rhizobium jaguaris]|uniref:Uncharacterized protein n=1 Tax=Rhizobium jaguaris TaxID=1312183 RepID=A0A387FUR8_9HYPH|nr:hypothetical protein [Rhizobium jaguaris]AYG62318.1 hypothetical protein CCGE525_26325 [Rhizobium jaguaris]